MKKKLLLCLLLSGLFIFAGCSLVSDQEPTKIEKEIVQIESTITDIFEEVSPACVGIYATSHTSGSSGSGVIYREDKGKYYVVTNNHVVEGMTKVQIYLGGTKYYTAQVVGTDPKNDIAVLTFSLDLFGGNVTVIDFLNYTDEIVIPGQTAIAIGCPLGLQNFNTVTTGIVSKVTTAHIQTNTDINPGNSGGGLFNASGRLIGIVTEKEVYTSGTDTNGNTISVPIQGIGYAIALNVVKKCVQDIESKATIIERPVIGIEVKAINRYVSSSEQEIDLLPNSMDQGLLIVNVIEDSAAAKAGVKNDDVILSVDGQAITSLDDLGTLVGLKLSGDTLTLEIYRKSAATSNSTIIVTL